MVATGIRFLDHVLELFARHGGFDLGLDAQATLTSTSTTSSRTSASPWVRLSSGLSAASGASLAPAAL